MPTGNTTSRASANKTNKKQRGGACDACRRRKIRCEGAKLPGDTCICCIVAGMECTYDHNHKKRGPKSEYVKQLEMRVQMLEEMLRKLQPEINLHWDPDLASEDKMSPAVSNEAFQAASRSSSDDETDLEIMSISEHVGKLIISNEMDTVSVIGSASNFMLIKDAMNVQSNFTIGTKSGSSKRLQFWSTQPWAAQATVDSSESPHYDYPEPDLLNALVGTYFTHCHTLIPIFHEPTFKQSVETGLHLRDQQFGRALLLVCAVASRHSDDPRVLVAGSGSQPDAGWKWFKQIELLKRGTLYETASLQELQFYCLAAMFVSGTARGPESSWTLIGMGIRHAQRLGIHRRKPEGHKLTLEDELKKRAFWGLILLERMMCTNLGRTAAMREADFDVEPLVECDDEYWKIGSDFVVEFNQPPEKPSLLSFLNCYSRLGDVSDSILTTLYSTKKYKVRQGLVGDQWEQRTVAELDSSLNKWIESIPHHLRWDSAIREGNPTFLRQSAMLHSAYYAIQIQIHRPFTLKPSSLTLSSLAICRNAARSCSHMLALLGVPVIAEPLISAFGCGMILLLDIPGPVAETTKELMCLQKCMKFLASVERRWQIAGVMWDIVNEVVSAKGIILPAECIVSDQHPHRGIDTDPTTLSSQALLDPSYQNYLQNPGVEQDFTNHAPTPLDREAHNPASLYRSSGQSQAETSLTATSRHTQLSDFPTNTFEANLFWDMHNSTEPGSLGTSSNYSVIDPQNSTYMPYPPSFEDIDTGRLDVWPNAPAGFNILEWNAYIASLSAQEQPLPSEQ